MYSSAYRRAVRLLDFADDYSNTNLIRVSCDLRRLVDTSVTDQGLQHTLMLWCSDCLLLAGDLRGAIDVAPPNQSGRATSMVSNRLLNLKMWAQLKPCGTDLLGLVGPKLSKSGRENLEEIASCINVQIEAAECDDMSLLETWSKLPSVALFATPLFNGAPIHHPNLKDVLPGSCGFDSSVEVQKSCADLFRVAENNFWVSRGLPRVGEGWPSETNLYYSLKRAFPDEIVIQHATPTWLGRQHLDVFMPARNVAVEYQGPQHFKPIAFFGGQAGYKNTVRRDRRKRRLCLKNGVHLLAVKQGYRLEDLVALVRNYRVNDSSLVLI